MRPFEIFLILALLASIGLEPFKKYRRASSYFIVLGIILFLGHLLFEHLRWQMVPTYIVLAVLTFFHSKHTFLKIFSTLLLLGLASLLIYSFPVIKLPTPTGPYAVGTTTQYWADPSREEWFTPEDPYDIRELVVQIWYPAPSNWKGSWAPYIDHLKIRTAAIGDAGGFPGFLASYLELTKTNALLEAPPLAEAAPFPLILISHGITGMRSLHTSMAENLASHGYVVAALDHSYDANLTVFPDGHTADYRSDLTAHPDSAAIRHRQLDTRVKDILFLLDQFGKIEEGDVGHPLTGYLDLNHIGVLGHSYGGSTCIQAAKIDSNIRACLALDGWINPLPDSSVTSGIRQPFLFLGRPGWDHSDYPSNYSFLENLLKRGQPDQQWITVEGTEHLDFTDVPLFSPHISRLLEVGTRDHRKVVALVNQIALEFFDQSLRSVPSPILTGKQSVPRITFH